MHRRTVILVLTVLALVALSISAATVTNPVESPDDWGAEVDEDRESWFDDQFDASMFPDERPIDVLAEPVVQELLAWVLVFAVLVGIGYTVYHHRRARPYIIAGFVGLVGLWALIRRIEWGDLTRVVTGIGPEISVTGWSSAIVSVLTDSTVLAILALSGVALLAITLVASGSIGQRGHSAAVAAIGSAAGRAADEIGHATGDTSGVHRAWKEMVSLLDLDEPRTTTTREFAAAAVAAGMRPDDVEALTELFEAVRYSDRSATPDLERQAERILRRIAKSYGGGDG